MSHASGDIRSVLLPLQHGQLLLPNASVAEVVGYQEPEAVTDSPDWLLGLISWRQQGVPLICFDQLLGMPTEGRGQHARIAICNTLGNNPQRPHIAILTKFIPHLVRVSDANIEPVTDLVELGKPVLRQVLIDQENAWIPALDVVEWLVEEVFA